MRRIEVVFYRAGSGVEPVREWLLGLSPEKRRVIGHDMMRVQYRWPVGMPVVRPMGKGLFEVRSRLPDSSTARLLFCFYAGTIYALHGFIKKAQRTPLEDLRLARERMKDIGNG